MRIRSLMTRVALLFAFVAAAGVVIAKPSYSAVAQGNKSAQTKVSQEEQNLAKAILLSPDVAGKFKAAAELIKKYPKSSLRSKAARDLASEVNSIRDPAQKITLAQQYQNIFNEPSEQQMIMPTLIEALAAANRFDEAFSNGSDFLARNPDSLFVLEQLVTIGTNQAKQKNPKFIPQSLQFATNAIELIEANKKPAEIDDAGWTKYKRDVLPNLYQSIGLLNLVKGDRNEAKAWLAKAAELAPLDPFNYLLLAGILNDEYQEGAQRYRSMPDGAVRDQALKQALAILDQVIDAYARTIALAEGKERFASVRQQYLHDLESYYKYRHKNSTEGMQELIDKYKVPAK